MNIRTFTVRHIGKSITYRGFNDHQGDDKVLAIVMLDGQMYTWAIDYDHLDGRLIPSQVGIAGLEQYYRDTFGRDITVKVFVQYR